MCVSKSLRKHTLLKLYKQEKVFGLRKKICGICVFSIYIMYSLQ